ncbi:MAG: glycogen/starch synthase [Bacteroidaceae bacterium]|nr:glycogen/starch synthase [Bacteroidaceae bacterium]
MTNTDRVLFITQEIAPFVAASEMADICCNLPRTVQENSRDIRVFMPKWGTVNERRNQLHEVIRLSGINIIIDDTDHQLIIKVASIQSARIQVYFIDNDDYFQDRMQLIDEDGKEYDDNDERSIFYVRGVLETVKKLRWRSDIIHCHGCFTALAPLYIKKAYSYEPAFMESKIVYSLYDKDFCNNFPENFTSKLLVKGIEESDIASLTTPVDFIQLNKLAIDYSDAIIQQTKDVDPELIEYAKLSGKPFLPYQEENMLQAVNDFYDTVLEHQNRL